MKYIRTKDGIYRVAYIDVENDVWCIARNNNIELLPNFEQEANTIEELCDEFVWISIDNEYHNRKANEYGLRTSKMQLGCPQLKEIYGAIWTDKGLIYVAKMNESGVLELL